MFEVGDHVMTRTGEVHWVVGHIDSRIEPLGVILKSGLTERTRRENYESLTLFRKGWE